MSSSHNLPSQPRVDEATEYSVSDSSSRFKQHAGNPQNDQTHIPGHTVSQGNSAQAQIYSPTSLWRPAQLSSSSGNEFVFGNPSYHIQHDLFATQIVGDAVAINNANSELDGAGIEIQHENSGTFHLSDGSPATPISGGNFIYEHAQPLSFHGYQQRNPLHHTSGSYLVNTSSYAIESLPPGLSSQVLVSPCSTYLTGREGNSAIVTTSDQQPGPEDSSHDWLTDMYPKYNTISPKQTRIVPTPSAVSLTSTGSQSDHQHHGGAQRCEDDAPDAKKAKSGRCAGGNAETCGKGFGGEEADPAGPSRTKLPDAPSEKRIHSCSSRTHSASKGPVIQDQRVAEQRDDPQDLVILTTSSRCRTRSARRLNDNFTAATQKSAAAASEHKGNTGSSDNSTESPSKSSCAVTPPRSKKLAKNVGGVVAPTKSSSLSPWTKTTLEATTLLSPLHPSAHAKDVLIDNDEGDGEQDAEYELEYEECENGQDFYSRNHHAGIPSASCAAPFAASSSAPWCTRNHDDANYGSSKNLGHADHSHSENDSTSAAAAERQRKDDYLVRNKLAGMSYKDIKIAGEFDEAESTLRGRFRTLTKRKEQRVRKPEWKEKDVSLFPPPPP